MRRRRIYLQNENYSQRKLMRLRNGSLRELETCIFLCYFRRHVGDAHSCSSNKIVWEGKGKRFFSGQRFSLVHQRPQRWTIWICFKAMSGFSRFSTRSVLILLRALTADACPRSLEQVKLPRSENHGGRSLSRHQFRLGYWRREVRSGVGELDLYPGLNSICDLVLGDAYE